MPPKVPVPRAGDEIVRTILERRRRALDPPALAKRLEGVIAEWIRAATTWESLALGESRCLVFDTALAEGVTFSIRFWSEPSAPLLCELPSGRQEPALAKFFRPGAEEWVESHGFRIRGQFENYRRSVPATTEHEVAAAAALVVDALVSMIDYQGASRLVAALAHDYRWQALIALDSFSESEIARAFHFAGFRIDWIVDESGEIVDPPAFHCVKGGTESLIQMIDPLPGTRLYARARFSAELEMTEREADEHRRDGTIPSDAQGMFTISAIHAFTGGVTEAWLRARIREWDEALAEQRRALRRDRKRPSRATPPSETIH